MFYNIDSMEKSPLLEKTFLIVWKIGGAVYKDEASALFFYPFLGFSSFLRLSVFCPSRPSLCS